MTDERVDEVLAQLRTELSITPSPRLAAGVRARVSGRSARRTASLMWLAWAAASIVAVISVAQLWRQSTPVAPPADRVPSGAAPATSNGVAAANPLPAAPVAPARNATTVRIRQRAAVAVAAGTGPEVLVPPDQGIALRRLLVALRERRAIVPATAAAVVANEDLPELELLVIPLLRLEPLPGTPVGGGERKIP